MVAGLCTIAWSWSALAAPTGGRLKVLTYNVAGLPDGFMTAQPSRNVPLIGPLLGRYDLVFVQEDFAYGSELRRGVTLPFQSPAFVRGEQWNYGDGLSYFSRMKFGELRREAWRACHGMVDSYFDCLTPKGFASARVEIAEGVEVDVYNVHLDAGNGELDLKARVAQVEQLVSAIRERSAGRAVLLAGDTNIPQQQRALLTQLGEGLGLVDVCVALRCPDTRRIDRVFYRSSASLGFTPRKWSLDSRFVDYRQRPLSDHLAVAVEIAWNRVAVSSD